MPKEINEQNKKEEYEQMSIYEYEEKYSKHENAKEVKFFLHLGIALVGVIFVYFFFDMVMTAWNKNEYLGMGVLCASILAFIFLYIVPIAKIFNNDYFDINVNKYNAQNAKKHNKELRRRIADKIIDISKEVDGIGWYESKYVDDLIIARDEKDDKKIKESLNALYSGSIKKNAKNMIVKYSVKSGLFSAVSQSNKVDTLLIATINLQLIKDIIFLYGFRPSDKKLLKIFYKVIQNSLIAYGLGNIKLGNEVAKSIGGVAKTIPLLGNAISFFVDSTVQGLVNGTLTSIIGFQTLKYLNKEYKLQNVLDCVELEETMDEFEETCEEVKQELKKANSK